MRASNKIRFILAVISGELKVNNRRRADIEADLEAAGYDKMTSSKEVRSRCSTSRFLRASKACMQ
jgi:hypothetical protein